MPTQLLERIDLHARSRGETRSGFLQRIAELELASGDAARRQQLEDLLGPPLALGGDSARMIREDRESR